MSLSDPIGDMIARVKNAQARNHKKVELPSSNFKTKIADILKNEGFIKDFKISEEDKKSILSLELSQLMQKSHRLKRSKSCPAWIIPKER